MPPGTRAAARRSCTDLTDGRKRACCVSGQRSSRRRIASRMRSRLVATVVEQAGITDNPMAQRVPTVPTSTMASNGPRMAPRLSIDRSKP